MSRRRNLRTLAGSPVALLLLACSFALTAYAGVRLLEGDTPRILLWLVGAALLHDLVLLPLYSALDRAATRACTALGWREAVVHVRVPAALSGLLLLLWFPMISGSAADRYADVTGLSGSGFAQRWLLITAVLFALSGVVLVLRLRSAAKQRPPTVH